MNTTVVSTAELDKFGRWDAGFHCIVQRFKPLIDELMEKYSTEELVLLAETLNFEPQFATVICSPRLTGNISREEFLRRFRTHLPEEKVLLCRRRHTDIATYVAAASQYGVSKVLLDMLELAKKKKAKLEMIKSVLDTADNKGANLLKAALKHGGDKKEETCPDPDASPATTSPSAESIAVNVPPT